MNIRATCTRRSTRPALWLVAVVVVGACLWTVGTLPAQSPSTEAKTDGPPAVKKFRGRLPAYYKHVVSETQRKEIYGIQKTYAEKIHSLQTQVMDLIKQREAEVTAVLSAEQKQRVEKLIEDAKARRSRPKNTDSDTAESESGET